MLEAPDHPIWGPPLYLLYFALKGRAPDPRIYVCPRYGRFPSTRVLRAGAHANAQPDGPDRFSMRPDIADLIAAVLHSTCAARAGTVLATAHHRTGLAAIVDIVSGDEDVIAQTLRIVTERRARQSLGWPKGQRLFAPKEVEIRLKEPEHIASARTALRAIDADSVQ